MDMKKPTDKTLFFQELERELDRAKPDGTDLKGRLAEAENDIRRFFENPDFLTTALNAGALTYEHAFLRRTASKPKYVALVEQLLSEYRDARDRNPDSFYKFWADRIKDISRGTNNIAGVATLQAGKENLELDVLIKSYFRDAGDALEGSLQPLLRLRLDVLELLGRRRSGAPKAASMTFGSVVEELLSGPLGEDIYRPSPHSLSVSQWRNIAYHNSYHVDDDGVVVCSYGTKDRLKEIRLSLEDLIAALLELSDIFYAHKVAYEFFGVDHAKEIIRHEPLINATAYSHNASLAHGLASAGFSVTHAEQSQGRWSFVLIDKRNRSHREIKSALQEAVWSYVLFVNPTEFLFMVRSQKQMYRVGFVSTVQPLSSPLPPNFKGDIWSVEDSLRIAQITSSK